MDGTVLTSFMILILCGLADANYRYEDWTCEELLI